MSQSTSVLTWSWNLERWVELFERSFSRVWYKLVSFSIFPSPDQELNPSMLPAAHNTGGSLPDLTNIQFPPPLSTPLDPEDTVAFPSLSSSNSTGSLTTNLTHLGISAASHGNKYNLKTVKYKYTEMYIRWGCWRIFHVSFFFFPSPGIPTSSQTTMTVTAQRRQPPVVPLTLTSDLHLQQSPQQLSPTLSSPVNITQVRLCSAGQLQVVAWSFAMFLLAVIPTQLTKKTFFVSMLLATVYKICFGWCFYSSATVKLHAKAVLPTLHSNNSPVSSSYIEFYGTSLRKAHVCLSLGHASRITDAGAAARPVPLVQPADGSGPGSAAQWPPEAAAGPVTGHPAHHLANTCLPWDSQCQ